MTLLLITFLSLSGIAVIFAMAIDRIWASMKRIEYDLNRIANKIAPECGIPSVPLEENKK